MPVIVLSARSTSAEKVEALDAGADDYITKPFAMDELLARVRAAVRRGATQPTGAPLDVMETDSFTVDFGAHRVTRDGHPIRLTPTEWSLLELLARNVGKVVPGRQLLTEVWGSAQQHESHYLRVYMAQLRRKLEPDPARPKYLMTEPGLGYRLER